MSTQNPIIELNNLSKIFPSDNGEVYALQNVSLSVNRGEIFGIIGMSGAGKSTLVRCINYLERPTSGQVLYEGKELSASDEKELRSIRKSIGMIFQQFNLLEQRTALGNVLFALEIAGVDNHEARKLALQLLETVGLQDKAGSYPAQLSGGQKQRVAIARALANDPKILLCDEATSALDGATTRQILALLKDINLRLGVTIIVITHEMSVIEEICSRVAIIDAGGVAEIGYVNEIFASPKSAAGRRLVYPDGREIDRFIGTRCCRLVFDGNSSFEPILANMILECRAPVNILFADTKDIDGKAYGQMVLQMPEDKKTADKMLLFLKARNLTVEEVAPVDR
ncbi:MAG: ATP-binding cassette domain-containing protein [Eubacteriales bacterium]